MESSFVPDGAALCMSKSGSRASKGKEEENEDKEKKEEGEGCKTSALACV